MINQDFVDLLRACSAGEVRFLIVGAHALAVHGGAPAGGDLDVWVDATPANAPRLMKVLTDFGAPMADLCEADFASPGVIYQIGAPSGQVDILTELTGITFDEAWPDRIRRPFGDVTIDVIGRDAFIRHKRATGHPQDLADVEGLE